ncbi:sugar phosphate isomerase/epimerase [Anaerolineales bacterium HSG24]|nr:sugar phosphate isomerase/epimerase [Anaerolineales bacterium HSG24]
MKLGFLTVSLSSIPLNDIVTWAAETGFDTLELGCWPLDNTRDYSATQVDVATLTKGRADEIRSLFEQNQIEMACLTYCDNMLHQNLSQRQTKLQHLSKVIEAAAMLKVDTVCGFIGRDASKTIAENLELVGEVFKPLVEQAAEHNINFCVENCPMPGWQIEGLVGNVAHSPNVWDELFSRLPYDNFGINLDPSHLHWLGIDPIQAAADYASKTFLAHAKDTEIMKEQLYRRGIMDPVHGGWWRYRMPGLGEIDFGAFVKALQDSGYDSVLSIEHEDPEFEGSVEKTKEGLALGLKHLQELVGGAS